MESSGKGPEAGPSSATLLCDEKQETKQAKMIVNPETAFDDDDDDEYDENQATGSVGNFVPGPLLPLKDQLEKDKVFVTFLLTLSISLYIFSNLFHSIVHA